jgi:hypothetical protein
MPAYGPQSDSSGVVPENSRPCACDSARNIGMRTNGRHARAGRASDMNFASFDKELSLSLCRVPLIADQQGEYANVGTVPAH